jgi:acyl carrier protein
MWDSIAHVRIIAEIEDVLNVSVPIDRALKFRSIRDFIEAIAQ